MKFSIKGYKLTRKLLNSFDSVWYSNQHFTGEKKKAKKETKKERREGKFALSTYSIGILFKLNDNTFNLRCILLFSSSPFGVNSINRN